MSTDQILRKKHTGEPGNRGEFGTGEKAASGLTLEPGPAPASEEEGPPLPSLTIPDWAVPLAQKRVDAANRRLEKAGIEDRFGMDVTEPFLRTRYDGHQEMARTITLSHPTISYDGWEFVSALDSTPDGQFIARTRPGASLEGWRPEQSLCEHCNTRRHRTATYVLRHTDGTITQVGSTCIQDFLGVKPGGLWALDADLADQIDTDVEANLGSHTQDTYTPAKDVVAIALAASDGGRAYRSSNWYGPEPSTAQAVRNVLWANPRTPAERDELDELQAQADRYLKDGTVDEVLKVAAGMEGDSDYATNLRVLAGQEHVGPRHLGLLASAVTVWARDRVEQERRAAFVPPAKGWLAPEGTKIAGTAATVEKVAFIDNPYDPYGGQNTLVIMRADSGHTLKWFATGRKDLDTGQKLALTGGSVKKHDTYEGTDQTVLTRVKYDVQDADAE